MSSDKRDILKKISVKTGSRFPIQTPSIIDFASMTLIKTDCSKKKTFQSFPRDFLQSSWTAFLKNTRQWKEKWTTKDSFSLCLPWRTRKLLKPFNISGEFSISITKEPSILSSSICSSVQSFKSFKVWKNVDLTLRTSKIRFSIWLSHSCRWR